MEKDTRILQIAGTAGIVLSFILLLLGRAAETWSALIIVGLIELALIYLYKSKITSFVRNLYPKKIDTIVMLGLVPVVWILANNFGPVPGEYAAAYYLLGMLNSHFHERD